MSNERAREIIKEMENLYDELEQIYDNERGYYIGVLAFGDDDQWTERYCRLGYITKKTAENWIEEAVKNHGAKWYDTTAFEVDKEKYDKYLTWLKVYEAKRSLEDYRLNNIEEVRIALDKLTEEEKNVAKDLIRNVDFLRWMHPGKNDIPIKDEMAEFNKIQDIICGY